MSLSARIALVPSRRLARLATLVPAGGTMIAAATLAARWPEAWLAPAIAAAAVVAMLVVLLVADGRPEELRLVLSDDPEIAVVATSPALDGAWCLAAATLAWPGFSMLALERTGAAGTGRLRFVPAFDTELDSDDRRALARFLRWSMRGGAVDRGRPRDDGRR